MTDRHPRSDIQPLAEPVRELLHGPRVTLRQLGAADVGTLHALVLDNLDHLMIMSFAAHEPLSLDDRRELVDGWMSDRVQGLGGVMGIWIDDDLIGMAGLHRRAAGPESLEIGYWLAEGSVGSGRATEAALLLAEEAFNHEQIDVVRICADLSNDRSRATAERAGFRWVATQPTPPEMRALAGTDVEAVYELRRDAFDARWRRRFA